MGWAYFLHQFRIVFMLGFTLFAVWLVVKWVRHAWTTAFTLRDWLGAFTFWLGIISASVWVYEEAYYWVTHELPVTSGQALYYLLSLGFWTAVGGLLFGFVGHGWVRRATYFVSVVAAFQWASIVFPHTKEYVITEEMFAVLTAGTLLWYVIHLCFARFGPRERRFEH